MKELIINGSGIHVQMDEEVKPEIILGEEVESQEACACCDFCSRAGAGECWLGIASMVIFV